MHPYIYVVTVLDTSDHLLTVASVTITKNLHHFKTAIGLSLYTVRRDSYSIV